MEVIVDNKNSFQMTFQAIIVKSYGINKSFCANEIIKQ